MSEGRADPIVTDALIIGAGPVGLFQVFELGLQDIRAHVVDALPHPGGQCTELYADKPIYDIPALPVATGRELVERLLQQIAPFSPQLHLGQEVASLQKLAGDDGRTVFAVETTRGLRFHARTVFIAAGVGAFVPRRLKLDGIEAFEDSQLFYRAPSDEAFAGRHLVIVGGEDAAVDAAIRCAEPGLNKAASVTLVHRRDAFAASAEQLARLQLLRDSGALRVVAGQPSAFEHDGGVLKALQVDTPDDGTQSLPLDALLVCWGLGPKLGPIAKWGVALERRQVIVDTKKFETSEPGIYAVGDVNTYTGKRKLILCGFHEATLAAFGAAARLRPDDSHQTLYTTSSPKLRKLLGVAPPDDAASGGTTGG